MEKSIFNQLVKVLKVEAESDMVILKANYKNYELDVYRWDDETDLGIEFSGTAVDGKYKSIDLSENQKELLNNKITKEFIKMDEEKIVDESEGGFSYDDKFHAISLIH